ncbi:hypothetical protein NC653_030788 [Populus alba x Populus x berolinensis]|uniref:Late nodulin n=1 Tax=Populus alba x Populus x berolinensis TaxID=444605 RepID=A0AAD6LWV5_9ROSI|nr:hypothetical protein NC653_030788 [Populus alba x Populus x berolinensis]
MEARFYMLAIVLLFAMFLETARTCRGRDTAIHFYKTRHSKITIYLINNFFKIHIKSKNNK